ncbi:unnamed protein product [Eruca vesicaria subsp. sativa]|uniref:Uncharacterized protein n=1 Tax=Eruca vesicaria subsp. sativa TaxID=29727 RepID=A0ABC8K2X2_ERUVS|nr:unnamed protein product [Eruca vesicaria subsp. sativa]
MGYSCKLDRRGIQVNGTLSTERAASVAEEYEAAGREVLVDDEDDDGWLATHGKPKDKGNEDENLPSMYAPLDTNEKSGIRSIPAYFGAEKEDDDISDMEEFDEADNVVGMIRCVSFVHWSLMNAF